MYEKKNKLRVIPSKDIENKHNTYKGYKIIDKDKKNVEKFGMMEKIMGLLVILKLVKKK